MAIATSVNQSTQLIELGIDVNTADMTYDALVISGEEKMLIKGWKLNVGLDSAIKDNDFSYRNGYTIPAWSLSALIELMPDHIVINNKVSNSLKMDKEEGGIGFCYFFNAFDKVDDIIICDMTLINAAFEMMVYLLENKLIK